MTDQDALYCQLRLNFTSKTDSSSAELTNFSMNDIMNKEASN